MRWFDIIRFQEQEIQCLLDSIIVLANPDEKTPSHITLRGPYDEAPDSSAIESNIVGSRVHIIGVGNFFNEGQNTVFLRCGSDYIKKYWWKPNFPFNPHITLFDGQSIEFSQKLHSLLSRVKPYFQLTVGSLQTHRTVSGQKSFDLLLNVDFELVSKFTGREVDSSSIRKMPEWERLMIIDRICNNLTWLVREPNTRNHNSFKLDNSPSSTKAYVRL